VTSRAKNVVAARSYQELERMNPRVLQSGWTYVFGTIFGVALGDPVLIEKGLSEVER